MVFLAVVWKSLLGASKWKRVRVSSLPWAVALSRAAPDVTRSVALGFGFCLELFFCFWEKKKASNHLNSRASHTHTVKRGLQADHGLSRKSSICFVCCNTYPALAAVRMLSWKEQHVVAPVFAFHGTRGDTSAVSPRGDQRASPGLSQRKAFQREQTRTRTDFLWSECVYNSSNNLSGYPD